MKAKKLLAGVLTCTMVFAMGMTAFAADGEAKIKKSYKIENAGTVSPAETFKFTATCTGVSDAADEVTKDNAPKLTIGDAEYAAGAATVGGAERTLTITHDEDFPSVGIYTYQVNETVGNTAGVTYDTTKKTLVVTVTLEDGKLKETYALHDGDAKAEKNDTVENTYSAGDLTVTKEIAGTLGDKTKEFEFTVKFTKPENKVVSSTITATVAGKDVEFKPVWTNEGTYTYKFKLSDIKSATFKNIPYGVTYEVSEKNEGYASEVIEGKTSDTVSKPNATVVFKNTKNAVDIDTGINLTTLPYMLTIAAIFVIAAIAFVAKRRRFED